MAEFDALNVVRRSPDLHRDPEDSAGRDVSEFRIRINEASDQPRAGNAVDLGMLARGCDQACVRDQPGAGNAVDLGMLARVCDQACVRVI